MMDETSELKIQGLENDNTNSVKLVDDFFDDGTVVEYFDSHNSLYNLHFQSDKYYSDYKFDYYY